MVAKNHSIFYSDRYNGGRLVQNANVYTIYHYRCTKIDDAGGTVDDDDVKQDQETKSHLHTHKGTHINTHNRKHNWVMI